MTEASIINALSRYLDDRKYPFQLHCSFIYNWECDYWCMTSAGETREFEIKISRSDYYADAKKHKHKSDNGANYFYYVCPTKLILPEEVDSRYGLIYVSETGLEIVKKPKRLHYKPFDGWKELTNKMYWKWRALWVQKYRDKEITREEYLNGFSEKLEKEVL